ncbi:WD40/YVTN/BNR-like repeat-containing protein [Chitinophagaceae bacterium MMS25-I14]
MPRLKLTLFILACCVITASCKKDLLHWQKVQQIDSHTSNRINRILFINDSVGFAVGGERFLEADILTTTDGGYTWNLRSFPEAGKELYDITRSPDGRLFTCGFDGKILSSSDAGNNWTFKQNWYIPANTIAFTGGSHGLVAGGVSFDQGFITDIDGNGSQTSYDSTGYEVNEIRMADAAHGYLAGYGIMQRTADSGRTWQMLDIVNDNFEGMCIRGNNVWVCGYGGSIYKTADGGNNWDRLRNGDNLTLPRYRLYDILFTDEMNGYAVGEKGVVIYTDDGGKHWMEFDRFTSDHLHCISQCPNGDLLVAGENGAFFRLLKR